MFPSLSYWTGRSSQLALLALALQWGLGGICLAQPKPPIPPPVKLPNIDDIELPAPSAKPAREPDSAETRARLRAKSPVEDPDKNADVAEWIVDLGSPVAAKRNAATTALIKAGPRTMPKLQHALLDEDTEVRSRAAFVAQMLEGRAIAHLRRREGVSLSDRTGYARSVTIRSPDFDERDMQQLACLYRLEYLHLYSPAIVDSWLQHVSHLNRVSVLTLKCPRITDAAFEHIATLCSLESLVVMDGDIKGWGIAELATIEPLLQLSLCDLPLDDASLSVGLSNLKGSSLAGLGVSRCSVSNDALPGIAELDSLVLISLAGTSITDRGLRELTSMPKLERLLLSHTRIGDLGIRDLVAFPALANVTLSETNVTAKGCALLRDATRLEHLHLAANQFSSTDAVWLRAQLPHLKIHYSVSATSRPRK